MSFDIISWIIDPFVILFGTVLIGLIFGKIPFGKFQFGLSGTLFSGLFIGWGATKYVEKLHLKNPQMDAIQKIMNKGLVSEEIFTLFLILFVASTGIMASRNMGIVLKKYGAKFIILGLVVTAIGAVAAFGMTWLNPQENPYEISGVYTGALTSSPGLAAALETAKDHSRLWIGRYEDLNQKEKGSMLKILDSSENLSLKYPENLTDRQKQEFIEKASASVGIGYAISYPFGVLIVILGMQFLPKIFKIDIEEEKELLKKEMKTIGEDKDLTSHGEVFFDLISFAIICLCGFVLGNIKIHLGFLGNLNLGLTGGVLISALILGNIGQIGALRFQMNDKILNVISQLSLSFFLGIVGLKYGFKVFDALLGSGLYLAVAGCLVGMTAMLAGFVVGRYGFKMNWIILSGAICGAMTSTPGLGAAIDVVGSDEPAAGYGGTYPFALLGMVIFTILLYNIPF